MTLTWENLSFKTHRYLTEKLFSTCCCDFCFNLKHDREILNNLNGWINRGELIALMGPSGAGKSTLLKCLTQGKQYQGFDGIIRIGNLSEAVRASFINQNEEEHLLLCLTVSESLGYASRLKNPSNTSTETHQRIVNELIGDLDLEIIKNSTVEKCSGGEKKRLAIALELTSLAKPHFLFLDEPATGLDSFVGYKVVDLLSHLAARHNMAIVATIHQPSFKIFTLFTRAYIISGTRSFIYNGSPSNLENFLRDCGYRIDNNENPVDIAIELASFMKRSGTSFPPRGSNHGSSELLVDEQIVQDEYIQVCNKMIQKTEANYTDNLSASGLNLESHGLCKNGATFGLYKFWTLLLRSGHTSILKQKQFILIRLLLHVIVAGLLALLYNRTIGLESGCIIIDSSIDPQNCSCITSEEELRKESTTLRNIKFQFFSLLFLMFTALMPTVLMFPIEIKLFLNEYQNGWYSATSYYIAKTITEIPLQLIFSYFYTYFLYWFSQQLGMEEWYGGLFGFMTSRYSQFLIITILCCFIAQGLGFLIGILCVRSFNISIIISSSAILFLFLFSGFFVKRVEMVDHTAWITYLSFIRFGFESLLIIIYGQDRCSLPEQSSVLLSFGLDDNDLQFSINILIAHLLIIRIAAFFVMIYMTSFRKFFDQCKKGN